MAKNTLRHRLFFTPAFILSLGLALPAASETTLDIDSEVNADFGDVEFTAAATGNLDMGSNGTISYPGGFTGAGLGVAGQFRIRLGGLDAETAPYTIACDDSSAAVSDGSGDLIPIQADFVITAGTRTSFGGGNACNGLGSLYGTYSGNNRTIYIGTRLNISSPLGGDGIYSTSNPGGTPLTFEVILE